MEYYTYAYLREDGTPYYIGKGKGNRAYVKHQKGKSKKVYFNTPPKERILILKNNLTEDQAYRHEMYMIFIFGRKDIETGILRNLTDGGEGAKGNIPWNKGKTGVCPEHQKEMNRKMMNDRYSNGFSVKGENNPRAKIWKITFKDGTIKIIKGLQSWADVNGYSRAGVKNVAYGKWKRYMDIVSIEQVSHYPSQRAMG